MTNEHWQMVYQLVKTVSQSVKLEHKPRLGESQQGAAKTSGGVVKIRSSIRNALDILRVDLSKTMHERDSYYILFPLVVFFDELVQLRLETDVEVAWPLLQTELFDTDLGGDVFYDILETLLVQPQTDAFVNEVFYFCLKAGFKGKYHNDPVKIASYQSALADRIGMSCPADETVVSEVEQVIRYYRSPAWYYVPVSIVLVFVYFGLNAMSAQDNQDTLDCFRDSTEMAKFCDFRE